MKTYRCFSRGKLSASHSLTYPKMGRLETPKKPTETKKELSLDIPTNPLQAMEYLSRSWSPSSSDFFQILSLNCLSPPSEDDAPEKREGRNEEGGKRARVDDMLAYHPSGRRISSPHRKHKSHFTGWTNVLHMKAWFGGEIFGSLSQSCREKRKEELRLHTAEVHAALSVAQLAAAVAGTVAASGGPSHAFNNEHPPKEGALVANSKPHAMKAVLASAAALLATVCAEAAEMAGANRDHIAVAISSGLAAQTPADMLTLTATAATSLRGAATLKLRASAAATHVQDEGQEMMAKGAELPIRTPLGKIHIRMVCVINKHDKLMLRLGKKYLQGAVTTYKQHRIMKVEDAGTKLEKSIRYALHGFCSLILDTTGGTVEVLFDDKRQRKIWKTTISNLLRDKETTSISPCS